MGGSTVVGDRRVGIVLEKEMDEEVWAGTREESNGK